MPDTTGSYHAVSLSGGKDSTAMLLLMIERGMPIDAVISADTGMEFPEMYEHLAKVDAWPFFGLNAQRITPSCPITTCGTNPCRSRQRGCCRRCFPCRKIGTIPSQHHRKNTGQIACNPAFHCQSTSKMLFAFRHLNYIAPQEEPAMMPQERHFSERSSLAQISAAPAGRTTLAPVCSTILSGAFFIPKSKKELEA